MAMPGYGTYGFDPNLPPEIDAEQQRIAKQQAIAEAMLQRGMTPLPTNQGPLHWTQGIAQVLNAYSGRRGVEEAAKSRTGLGEKYRQGLADEVKRIAAMRQGVPASSEQIVDEQANGGECAPATITAPARPGDPLAAANAAVASPYARVQKIGDALFAQLAKPPVKTDLGDRWKVEYADGRVAYEPKAATPDTVARENGANARFAGVSGNTAATIAGQDRRHATPSGSAILGSNTTLATHNSPSGSALVAADTARRGQDITAETTRRGQDISADPVLQARLAEWKAAGTARGKSAAEAAAALPQSIATARQGVDLIDQMIGDLTVDENGKIKRGTRSPHPGFSVAVGASAQPGFQFIPGTDKAGFYALKDQVLGGAFLEAFQALKGGGAITEIEGTKATSAITRMATSQNEAEFVKAAREFQQVIRDGAARAAAKASRAPNPGGGGGGAVLRFDAQGNPVP